MRQTWRDLLFMHWPLPAAAIRPLVPRALALDTREGRAWLGITPFRVRSMRALGLPALPLLRRTHEVNVRTYVHHRGVPGVYFLSLDASNPLAVLGARLAYGLPYYAAEMRRTPARLDGEPGTRFAARRIHPGAPPARLDVTWTPGAPCPTPEPGSRAFFLAERYCLYHRRGRRLYRTRIHHRPWSLCAARVRVDALSLAAAHGLTLPEMPPVVHAQAEPLEAGVWPPERL